MSNSQPRFTRLMSDPNQIYLNNPIEVSRFATASAMKRLVASTSDHARRAHLAVGRFLDCIFPGPHTPHTVPGSMSSPRSPCSTKLGKQRSTGQERRTGRAGPGDAPRHRAAARGLVRSHFLPDSRNYEKGLPDGEDGQDKVRKTDQKFKLCIAHDQTSTAKKKSVHLSLLCSHHYCFLYRTGRILRYHASLTSVR